MAPHEDLALQGSAEQELQRWEGRKRSRQTLDPLCSSMDLQTLLVYRKQKYAISK